MNELWRGGSNPLFAGWHADPEVMRAEGRLWVFSTGSGPFEDQVALEAFSTVDGREWTRHGRVLDRSGVGWLRKSLWAPVVFPHRGRYWMVFSANDIQVPESPWWRPECAAEPQDGGLGLAVAERPEGPYRDALGHPLVGEVWNGAQPIDACVFRDEGGGLWMAYGGWGRCNLAKLKDDLSGIEPQEDGRMVREITPEGYVEGPFFFRRGGVWYFLWSEGDWTRDNYRVAYARAATLAGPWRREGVVLASQPPLATGAGHCSVLLPEGAEEGVLFYHRRPIPSEGPNHRVVCADRLRFDAAGRILPVEMT